MSYLQTDDGGDYSLALLLREKARIDYETFKRIINYLDEISELDWNNKLEKIKENIMSFDEDNKRLKKLIIDLN